MANTVHVVYQLDDKQRSAIAEAGGKRPTVREVSVSALQRMLSEGFVRCNPDGSKFVEDTKPAPAGVSGSAGGSDK